MFYQERFRPQFHFTAQQNWLNDPNGLVYFVGEFHLCFQHNPVGREWGNMTWGHAVSPDLLHWKQGENVLLPDALGTMFSGSAVIDWENTSGLQEGENPPLVALYTAAGSTSPESEGQPFTQCLAYSNDNGQNWIKYPLNPVLAHIVQENRDPKIAWHNPSRRWIMALYLDKSDFGLFVSPDLIHWQALQTLTLPGSSECPDFFEIPLEENPEEKKWVFFVADNTYLIGAFDGTRFHAETEPLCGEYGANCYAAQTYSDIPQADGRRIQIAWMRGGSYPDMPFNQQMTFPCRLTLRRFPEGLRLCKQPITEITLLHESEAYTAPQVLSPTERITSETHGELLHIRVEVEIGSATEIGLDIRGERLIYKPSLHTLSVLGTTASCKLPQGLLALEILVDRTSLEVFADGGRVCITSCFLPAQSDQEVSIFAQGGEARLNCLHVARLRSSWQG